MHPQEFVAAHSLHSSTIDGQWWVFGVASLEVNNSLFGFADIQQEVVVSVPRGQKIDLSVVGLVVPGDETHQSCVVCKLHHVIGAVGWCVVVSQQGEKQGTEHTALGAPVLSMMLLKVLLLTRTACVLSLRKSILSYLRKS